jgi:hypothetical protein
MARGASSARRIEINRGFFDELQLAMADALFDLAKQIVEGARVPDAPPIGEGLLQGGGALAYIDSKKVAQSSTGNPTAVKKPRAAKLRKGTVTAIGGFGFPARFVEEGTVRMAGHPFLTPALLSMVPEAGSYIAEACRRHRLTVAERTARGDTYANRRSDREATLDVMAKIGQKPMPGLA